MEWLKKQWRDIKLSFALLYIIITEPFVKHEDKPQEQQEQLFNF